MILHYIKIAFRNLWKYKTQSVISIAGLAVGFTCFALSALWMRYEMSYDSFHKHAEDIYLLTRPEKDSYAEGISVSMPSPFMEYLKETFPEVKEAVRIAKYGRVITTEAGFLELFDVKILEGSIDFTNENQVALTRKKAQEVFGEEDPIGKMFKMGGAEYPVAAILSEYSDHSNYPLEVLLPIASDSYWTSFLSEGLLQLHPHVDANAFKKKLEEHVINQSSNGHKVSWTNTSIVPLTQMRHLNLYGVRNVTFGYIQLFALAGLLVIVCSLFNYLMLFVSRFRIREKEFALRMVCGSSWRSLYGLLSVEFLLTLLTAFALGVFFVQLSLKPFMELAEVKLEVYLIYKELILYMLGVIALAQLAFLLVLVVFKRRSLVRSIQKGNRQVGRKASLVLQLVISIVFIFSATVIVKQVIFLHNSRNIGFEFHNREGIYMYSSLEDMKGFADKLSQIPEITETVYGYPPLLPIRGGQTRTISSWQDKTDDQQPVSMEYVYLSPEYFDLYGFQLKEGKKLENGDPPTGKLINESAVRLLGWDNPVGKTWEWGEEETSIIQGVIRNVYHAGPTIEPPATCYFLKEQSENHLSYVFEEGTGDAVKQKIETLFRQEFPELPASSLSMYDIEEEYNQFFKSEEALIVILNFVALICFLISIFGFVSLVSLNLEEKRKEMAIRKINGATLGNILGMYFRTYFGILLIGSGIAFVVGYFLMKRWLEQYIHQTSINAWIYILILLGMTLVIVASIGWRILKASRENPAEELKTKN